MWKFFIFICVFVDVGNSQFPSSSESCTSPFDTPGTCIILHDCVDLFLMLNSSSIPLLPAIHNLLRKSQCGFDGFRPKVCCPDGEYPTKVTTTQKPSVITTKKPIEQSNKYTPENNGLLPPDVTNHVNLPLLPVKCGDTETEKIISGEKTSIFEFPWMALIAYSSKKGLAFRCGGTIINERFILTAAHCVTNLREMTLAGVRVGDHDISTDEDCEGPSDDRQCASLPQDFFIEDVYSHPEFNVSRLQNDIAIIKLGRPINFTKNNVFPICLPVSEELRNLRVDGLSMVVAGWGATNNGTDSPSLLKARLPVVTNAQCVQAYKSYLPDGIITYKQMCAGGSNSVDSCKGDSGGPLKMIGNVGGVIKYIQHGVVSYGYTICGTVGKPAVYTRLAYYMDWILDQLSN